MDEMGEMMFAIALVNEQAIGDAWEEDRSKEPLPVQLGLKPGDKALCINTQSSKFESSTQLVCLLDPQDWAQEFPDYLARMSNGFVLCRWRSHHEQRYFDHTGWFARSRLVPLEEPTYQAALNAIQEDNPDFRFLQEVFSEFEYNRVSMGEDIDPLRCENCSSVDVIVRSSHTHYVDTRAAWTTVDGVPKLRVIHNSEHRSSDEHFARKMICSNCGWSRVVSEDELHNISDDKS